MTRQPTILVFGGTGQVGWEVRRALSGLGRVVSPSRSQVDFSVPSSIADCIDAHGPDIVVNAAAYTDVDRAEQEPEVACCVNGEAVGVLARAAQLRGCLLVHFSTDYVFDGETVHAYLEEDEPRPISAYGLSKLRGENELKAAGCRHLLFRTSWIYSLRRRNFPFAILEQAYAGRDLTVVDDSVGSPTSAFLIGDVVATALRAWLTASASAQDTMSGTYHLQSSGRCSWFQYAHFLVIRGRELGLPIKTRPEQIRPISMAASSSVARRPVNCSLDTRRLRAMLNISLPEWQQHVQLLLEHLRWAGPNATHLELPRTVESACAVTS
jgi:dTDP-4-dehydrorhamnose reductase